jgi:hypothetical protein
MGVFSGRVSEECRRLTRRQWPVNQLTFDDDDSR